MAALSTARYGITRSPTDASGERVLHLRTSVTCHDRQFWVLQRQRRLHAQLPLHLLDGLIQVLPEHVVLLLLHDAVARSCAIKSGDV